MNGPRNISKYCTKFQSFKPLLRDFKEFPGTFLGLWEVFIEFFRFQGILIFENILPDLKKFPHFWKDFKGISGRSIALKRFEEIMYNTHEIQKISKNFHMIRKIVCDLQNIQKNSRKFKIFAKISMPRDFFGQISRSLWEKCKNSIFGK